LPRLHDAIASPSVAAGRHERHGIAAAQRLWPMRRAAAGDALHRRPLAVPGGVP